MCLISACCPSNTPHADHTHCPQKPETSSFHLLELAANNDLRGLKKAVEEQGAQADVCSSWYCRQFGSNKMASVERSPLMIAALFGSMDVLPYLLDHLKANGGDINRACGADKASALLCAMSSGTHNMPDVVQLLLRSGADPTLVSLHGLRHMDAKSPGLLCQNATLEKGLLDKCMSPSLESDASDWKSILPDSVSETSLEDLEESMWNLHEKSLPSSCQFSSPATWSPKSTGSHASETHDSFQDRALDVLPLDVKSGIYSTDEFRMYSFKVRPCSKAYSHDWTECPFAHPGENARRRDPRKFHYSCVPCPDFRKGACRHGDACEYAHGVFESWLHPAQYRTRLCKDGTSCTRKVCFFAHKKEEVRPLYVSAEYAGNTCPSPCASPSSLKASSFLSGNMNLGLSSPSSDKSVGSTWTQPGLPTLRLPEGITHASRLRATLSARDMALDGQSMRDLVSLSAQARINAAVVAASHSAASSPVRDRKPHYFGSNSVSAANYEDVFCSAVSPRSPLQMGMQSSPRATLKVHDRGLENAALEELIAAVSSSNRHSPHAGRSLQGQYDDFGQMGMSMSASQLGSSGMWGGMGSPSSRLTHAAEVELLRQRGMASSACLSPAHNEDKTWLDWGSPTGKPQWSVSGDDLTRLRKSNSCKA